jgi:hypothetical protein
MTFQEALALAQFTIMSVAGSFVWWTARANRQYERDRDELRQRLEALEERLWDLHGREPKA